MPSESEKRRRKAIRHELEAAERIKAESALPAPKDQLEALFEWVDEHLEGDCDHSLRHTIEFIKINGLAEQQTVEWLREYGGYCDCEVVMNVQDSCPAFHEAASQPFTVSKIMAKHGVVKGERKDG